uniref:FXYD domain-containing ion transport regulator n=1 Tax=Sinocyclocheilus anshuiensis TaxID=1608454 RepID=A0A671L6A1_9TELE
MPDYELIRRGGLIFAAVLFCLGMAIIFGEYGCWSPLGRACVLAR